MNISIKLINRGTIFRICRQRDELQGQREGPLRSGRCVPLRDAEGGAGPGSTGPGSQAELLEESASGPVPTYGQQAGHEVVRQQKGSDEGTNQAKGCRSLGHPSLFQFSVSPSSKIASPSATGNDEISISCLDSGCFIIMFDPRYIILSIDRVINDLCQFFIDD